MHHGNLYMRQYFCHKMNESRPATKMYELEDMYPWMWRS